MENPDKPLREPDQDLRQRVMSVLWEFDQIRNTRPPLSVTVKEGVVNLRGVVRTRTIAQRLVARLVQISGVATVKSELTDDATIELEIARKLAVDERTRYWAPRIWITSLHGEVHLEGRVPDNAANQAASEIGKSVNGVRRVENALC